MANPSSNSKDGATGITGAEFIDASSGAAQKDPEDPDIRFAVFSEGIYPYTWKLKRAQYEKAKQELQVELLKMQSWVQETGQKVVIVFEGRDAAGKGGTIKRFMEHMNPRYARVVALTTPTDEERTQWYFQRYIEHLPSGGELVLFDRSWYNRAGVEKVMGFSTPAEYLQFTRQAPLFEKMLVDSGIRLIKLYFSVSREEQRRRFDARINDPLKRWKLSPVDRASIDKWDEYTDAKRLMFFYTHTPESPWYVIKSDDKKRARLNAMRLALTLLPYPDKDLAVARPPDPLIVGTASDVLEESELSDSVRELLIASASELRAEEDEAVSRSAAGGENDATDKKKVTAKSVGKKSK